ncbi:MAG: hypothetical protein EHM62_03410, partial [Methylococcus sp.]
MLHTAGTRGAGSGRGFPHFSINRISMTSGPNPRIDWREVMNQIDIFPWNDSFDTGLPEIDEQHRRLVQLLNTLASHIAFGSGVTEVRVLLDDLADYAVHHFQTEESIWHAHFPGDPMETAHLAAHQAFVRTVVDLRHGAGTTQSGESVHEALLAFLTRWLAAHIL